MTSEGLLKSSDPEVDKLRNARKSPAVLKLRLAKLRSELGGEPIFAFEGDDDKFVYYQWMRRIKPELSYASFPCGGKDQLLRLLDSVRTDRTGLNGTVFFFVDRDFDELKGRAAGIEIFVTECYSVENYLVCEDVLDELLKMEFHCHAAADLRAQIRAIFEAAYTQFLTITKDINSRLHAARMFEVPVKPLSEKLSRIASVELERVTPGSKTSAEIVELAYELSVEQIREASIAFENLDPRARYRGKFALMFFMRWLDELAAEAKVHQRGVFARLDNRSSFRRSEITLTALAAKSPLPKGLDRFVQSIEMQAG